MNRKAKFIRQFLTSLILTISFSPLLHAAVTVNFVESGGNVVATANGTINTAGLTLSGTITSTGGFVRGTGLTINPTEAFSVGSAGVNDVYQNSFTSSSLPFSAGSVFSASSSTGTSFGYASFFNGVLYVPQGYVSNAPISGSSTWGGHTFASLGLIPGTYVVTWGSGGNADSLTVNVGAAADTTNPILQSSSPADNAIGVSTAAPTLGLTFDEAVVVDTGVIRIFRTSDNVEVNNRSVTGAMGSGTANISITFENALAANTEYYALIPATAFDDTSGNSYAGISSTTALSFTTAAAADTTNPTLQSSSPADNATGVAVGSNIVFTFDETVDAETGNITIKRTSDDSTVETIDVTGGKVTGTGTASITVNPGSDLAANTEYYVLIGSSAFDDTAGNSYAGIASTTELSFTTAAAAAADTTNPTLQSSSPADNTTGVAVGSNIVLTFDEPVNAVAGNVTIKRTSDDSTVEIMASTSIKVTGSGTSTITINPTSDLAANTEYYVLIDATAFDDLSGNSYAGIASTTALSFTTISATLPDPFDDNRVGGLIQAQTQTAARVATQALNTVGNRLSQLITPSSDNNDTANNSHQGIKIVMGVDPNVGNALAQTGLLSGLNSSGDIFNNGWAVWTEGTIILGKSEGGSDFQIDGITVGFDKRITPQFTAGLALRAAQADNDVGATEKVDSDAYSATVYGSYVLNNNSYLQGALGYSDIEFSTERTDNTGTLSGDRDADQVYASLSFTRQFEYKGVTLLPYGSFDGSYSTLDSYSEKGTGAALTFHEQDVKSLSATIGLRGQYLIQQSNGWLAPRFHINYQGDIDSDSDAKINYVSIPSTTFSRSFDAISSSSWLFGVGFDYQYNNLSFSADYEHTEEVGWGYSDAFRLKLEATF